MTMNETYKQRLHRYVQHASEAGELGARSRSLEGKEECLVVAASWLDLARGVDTTQRTPARGAKTP
jgi:hypothetical protein